MECEPYTTEIRAYHIDFELVAEGLRRLCWDSYVKAVQRRMRGEEPPPEQPEWMRRIVL